MPDEQAGDAGPMDADDATGPPSPVAAAGPVDLAEVARQLRGVLAELDDPDSDLQASAATRHRIEGAALALDRLSPPE